MKPAIRHDRGFTLIELMVSMVLGLVIIGGATSVILANRQSYRTNEALSQVQESARTAFELLARDTREAGITGCDNSGRMANVLDPSDGVAWWQPWFGIAGYEGGEVSPAVPTSAVTAERVAGTDTVILQGIQGLGLAVDTHTVTSANIKISAPSNAIGVGDVLVVCDFDHAAMFQVTNYNDSNVTLVHNTGSSVSPGNFTKGLGYPPIDTENGNPYVFGRNSQLARLSAVTYYIGNNGRAAEGGRSLYRRRIGVGATQFIEEVVAGVTDLQLTYREQGVNVFREADDVVNWSNVSAVMVTLTLRSADQRVTNTPLLNSGRIERTFSNIITLRNRVP